MSERRQLTEVLYLLMCSKVSLADSLLATVNEEEQTFLTEVAVSAEKEWQEEANGARANLQKLDVQTIQSIFSELPQPANIWPSRQSSSSSAACAAAMPTPVSLSESEPEEDTLAVTAEPFPAT